ncbi:hypothetical protein G6L37_05220 [Agrobacterium rubi]|nr:hypothetical protein [Agrobacterium rubi]NTF24757.1 hypothetical protein [Agrobacterium rubi]
MFFSYFATHASDVFDDAGFQGKKKVVAVDQCPYQPLDEGLPDTRAPRGSDVIYLSA